MAVQQVVCWLIRRQATVQTTVQTSLAKQNFNISMATFSQQISHKNSESHYYNLPLNLGFGKGTFIDIIKLTFWKNMAAQLNCSIKQVFFNAVATSGFVFLFVAYDNFI